MPAPSPHITQRSSLSHPNARLTVHGRRLLVDRVRAGRPVTHVADEMGISRTTAHKWVRRGTCSSARRSNSSFPTNEVNTIAPRPGPEARPIARTTQPCTPQSPPRPARLTTARPQLSHPSPTPVLSKKGGASRVRVTRSRRAGPARAGVSYRRLAQVQHAIAVGVKACPSRYAFRKKQQVTAVFVL